MTGIDLINEQEIEKKKTGLDLWANLNKDLSKDEKQKRFLENYLLLTNHSDMFSHFPGETLYYNRFYWFQRFYNRYSTLHAQDELNMRQYEFKILEEGERLDKIDWKIVEQIVAYCKNLES
jgi:hypothetical protein